MEPIATYSEVRFDGSRTFTLLPDRLIIRGKRTLVSEFEISIALTTLDQNPDRLRFRNASFAWGMWIAIVSYVTCAVLVSGFQMSFAAYAPGLLACTGMSGVMLMLATYRKVEFVQFKNDGGIVVLDLARAGKSAAQLDSFIDALTKQISVAREWANK